MSEGAGTSRVRVDLLGAVSVTIDGAAVALGTPMERLLLARLVLAQGRPVATETLIDDLWQDAPQRARHSVQQYASRLRGRLGGRETGVVISAPGGYALDVASDLADLEHALSAAARARARGDLTAAVALWRQGERLWRGPALADLVGMPFAAAEAARLEERRCDALESRVEAQLDVGRAEGAVEDVRLLVEQHPFRERARALLVRALHLSGRRADALAAFEQARRTLVEELGLDPGPELVAAQTAVLDDDRPPSAVTAPPAPAPTSAASSTRTPTPPPRYRTTSIGREDDIEAVARLLAPGRIVTLTGAGGVGKTRLACELAAVRAGDYGDGVAFAALAPVPDAGSVIPTVLEALGAEEEPTRPAEETLATVMRDRAMLVLLDNAEHLLSTVADVADRLADVSPRSAVVVTSREPLRVRGEQVYPVSPLDPAAGGAAATLLLQRGRLVAPDLAPSTGLDRIVQRLDGIPLAIEMVATWTRAMGTDDILTHLGDLLTLDAPGEDPRRRTMAAVVAWSEDLLSPEERSTFARLCVLAGEWDLAAAAAVLEDESTADVLRLVGRLVDASLVEVAESGRGRYRMLEPIRQHGVARLAERGEEASVRDRHLRHFATIARDVRRSTSTPDQPAQFDRADRERANLRAAHEWALASGQADLAGDLVADLSWYWLANVNGREALDRTERTLALGPTGRVQVRLLISRTQSLVQMGRYAEAASVGLEAVAAAIMVEDRRLMGVARATAGRAAGQAGAGEEGRALLQQAREDFRAAGSRRGEADALIGIAQSTDTPTEECVALAEEAVGLAGGGLGYIDAAYLFFTTFAAVEQGRFDDAVRLTGEGIAIHRTGRFGGSASITIQALHCFALVRDGSADEAAALLVSCLDEAANMPNGLSRRMCGAAVMAWAAACGHHELVARASGLRSRLAVGNRLLAIGAFDVDATASRRALGAGFDTLSAAGEREGIRALRDHVVAVLGRTTH